MIHLWPLTSVIHLWPLTPQLALWGTFSISWWTSATCVTPSLALHTGSAGQCLRRLEPTAPTCWESSTSCVTSWTASCRSAASPAVRSLASSPLGTERTLKEHYTGYISHSFLVLVNLPQPVKIGVWCHRGLDDVIVMSSEQKAWERDVGPTFLL